MLEQCDPIATQLGAVMRCSQGYAELQREADIFLLCVDSLQDKTALKRMDVNV